MDDTSAEIRRLLRERYAVLSGADRLAMGAAAFESARNLVLASFPSGLPAREVRRRLCKRFYGALADQVFGGPPA